MEYGSESYHLLLENPIYLKALERSSVSVYSLGFDDYNVGKKVKGTRSVSSLSSPSTHSMSTIKSTSTGDTKRGKEKVLRAVVPTETQAYFMDRVGETLHFLKDQHQKEEKAKKKRATSAGSTQQFFASSNQIELPLTLPKDSSRHGSPKQGNSPTKAKLPTFGRPTRRMIEEMEEAKRFAEKMEKEELKKKKLHRKLSVSQDGREFVYDYSGYRIPLEEYEQYKKEYQEKLSKKEHEREEKQNEMFNMITAPERKRSPSSAQQRRTSIIEKTSKYVGHLREAIEAERAGKQRLPETTLAMEPGEKVLPLHHFQMFPEYLLMEKDDVMITIEHCHDCESHNWANHHIEEQYINAATNIQDTLEVFMKDFPVRFYCLMKPIADIAQVRMERAKSICALPNASPKLFQNPPPMVTPSLAPLPASNGMNTPFFVGRESRTGALEVQIMIHTGADKINHILHSKLLSGDWPRVEVLLSQIEYLLNKNKYSRIRGKPYGVVRRRSTVDPNIFENFKKRQPRSPTAAIPSPEEQMEKLKKDITLVPSFDQRNLRKVEVSDFFQPRGSILGGSRATTPTKHESTATNQSQGGSIQPSPRPSSASPQPNREEIVTIVPAFGSTERKEKENYPPRSPIRPTTSATPPESSIAADRITPPPSKASTPPSRASTAKEGEEMVLMTNSSTQETVKLLYPPPINTNLSEKSSPQTRTPLSKKEEPEETYNEYDGDFEPVSSSNSPLKTNLPSLSAISTAAASPHSLGIAQTNNDDDSRRSSIQHALSNEDFGSAKQAVLEIEQMLRNDEYEDEQDEIDFDFQSPEATKTGRRKKTDKDKGKGQRSSDFWDDDLYKQLGIQSSDDAQ